MVISDSGWFGISVVLDYGGGLDNDLDRLMDVGVDDEVSFLSVEFDDEMI